MIIGFLGKGGSGKSSLSYRFAKHIKERGNRVLAIDSDHNMDLTYNFGIDFDIPYMGTSLNKIKEFSGLKENEDYREVFYKEVLPKFTLHPKDAYTREFTYDIDENLMVMASGPHTSDILEDKSCSHILMTPLKVYLPNLDIKENEYVIIDEKAGADGVGTGVTTGMDHAIVVLEPTSHGIKTAKQIAELLEYYHTPYDFVLNKVREESDLGQVLKDLPKKPISFFSVDFGMIEPNSKISKENSIELEKMSTHFSQIKEKLVSSRLERTIQKFNSQKES